jgi:predicted nucleic acid-binding protein
MSVHFIDTNILVYAYDADAGDKHAKARRLLEHCWKAGSGVISTQVLQEFYVTVTKKLPTALPKSQAREIIRTYEVWPVYRPTAQDVAAASKLDEEHQLSFWDALIVLAAQKSGADTLLTEDLHEDLQIGSLKIVNPLK